MPLTEKNFHTTETDVEALKKHKPASGQKHVAKGHFLQQTN